MAKDGTQRGGSRIGAGRPRKSVDSKLLDGKVAKRITADLYDIETDEDDIPKPNSYISAPQRWKKDITVQGLKAPEIYINTFKWLKTMGCEKLVAPSLVEQYAMMYARYIDCEEMISKHGMIAAHPTTGNPCASPFVSMSQNFAKQANIAWAQIYAVVKENATENYFGNPNDEMEILLRRKKK